MAEPLVEARVCICLTFNTYPTKVKSELEKLGCKVIFLQGTRKQSASQSYVFDFTCEAPEGWNQEKLQEEVKR